MVASQIRKAAPANERVIGQAGEDLGREAAEDYGREHGFND